jgi:glycosyltransferase involved in cell wall biosynthesis
MNVYIINQFALRPGDKGSMRHFSLARFLVSRGLIVRILTSNIVSNSREDLKWPTPIETHQGVEFHCFTAPKYVNNRQRLVNHLTYSVKMAAYLFRHLKKGDVVIGSTPQPFSTYAAYIVSKIKGGKFIYEVRDLWPQTLIDLGGLSERHPMVTVMRFIERNLSLKSSKIVTTMPLAWKYFEGKYGIDAHSVTCIPQGVDVPKDEGVVFPEKTRFHIVYAGTLGLANRTEMIVEFCKSIKSINPQVHVTVYGDGPLKSWMEEQVRSHDLTNVTFKGTVPRAVVLSALNDCHAALALAHESPLYKYGISYNKLADYFLKRRPVIFIGKVAMNPVDVASAGLVITSNDPNEVALAISNFASKDISELKKMGENGYQYVLERHDINRTGQQLLDVISNSARE